MTALPVPMRDRAEARLHAELGRITDTALAAIEKALADGATSEAVAAVQSIASSAAQAAYTVQVAYLDTLTGAVAGLTPPTPDPIVVADVADPAKLIAEAKRTASESIWELVTVANEDWAYSVGRDIEWWLRRVSPGEVCGLCVQAAMRVYRTPSLRPIHDHCRCTVRPVLVDDDMGSLMGEARERFTAVTDDLADTADRLGAVRGGRKTRSRASNIRIDA